VARIRELPVVRRVLDELASNQRARWGLAAIGAGLLAFGYLVLYDAVEAQNNRLNERLRRITRLEEVAQDKDWIARGSAASGLSVQLEGRLWPSDTDGLALADFQDWITRMGREAGLSGLQIRPEIDTSLNGPLKLRKMSASVSGPFDPEIFEKFIDSVSKGNRLTIVDRLTIHSSPIQRFELTLATYLRPRNGEAGAVSGAVADGNKASPR
jgi:hypothetical protein